jgi:hypothetical protein
LTAIRFVEIEVPRRGAITVASRSVVWRQKGWISFEGMRYVFVIRMVSIVNDANRQAPCLNANIQRWQIILYP